ncbi:MAG: helix-turn-helix domain-containing protein [Opitutus sp.]
MVTNKLKELAATRAKLASLEQAIANELNRELASLPSKYGFASADDFARAVRAAGGVGRRRGRPPKSAARKAGKVKAAGGRKRRKRAVITDATRALVKKLVEAGKTGSEIAKAVRISLPSVQNVKKALGLVKKR